MFGRTDKYGMQPFYRIGLRNSLPSWADIQQRLPQSQTRLMVITDLCPIPLIRSELTALGFKLGELKLWQWRFDQPLNIHTDGQRQAAINWSLLPHSQLDFFDRSQGEPLTVSTNEHVWATHWQYPKGEPQPLAEWQGYGPALINPQQPHRPRALRDGVVRVTVTLELLHKYETAYQLLASAGRIRA